MFRMPSGSFWLRFCEDAPQRDYPMRVLFNAIRYVVKTGCQWRYLPNDLPPWTAVYQQARRWMEAGVFEAITHELRVIVRIIEDRESHPSGVIVDSRTLQSTPESGARAGFDGHKKKKGSKIHAAVDTLGNLLGRRISLLPALDRWSLVLSVGSKLRIRDFHSAKKLLTLRWLGRSSAIALCRARLKIHPPSGTSLIA